MTLTTELDDSLGLGHGQRLGVRVGDDEVDALETRGDHVVDGVAAAAPDAEHGDPRLQLGDIWLLQLDGHGTSFLLSPAASPRRPCHFNSFARRPAPAGADGLNSKTFLQPLAHAGDTAVSVAEGGEQSCLPGMGFLIGNLRINHQSDCGRKSGTLGRGREAGDTHRAPDSHIAGKDAARSFGKTRQLARRHLSKRLACLQPARTLTSESDREGVQVSLRSGQE